MTEGARESARHCQLEAGAAQSTERISANVIDSPSWMLGRLFLRVLMSAD